MWFILMFMRINCFVSALTLLISLSGWGGSFPCKSRFAQTPQECRALESWNNLSFTDVQDLDRYRKFTVIFHSITGFGWNGETNPKPGSFNERLLRDPSLISNNPKISASVISETKRKTFRGHIGLILEVSPENVVGASFEDAGSPPVKSYNEDELFMLELYSSNRAVDIITPKDVLARTVKYNEVVLTGTDQSSGRRVLATGIILRCDSSKMTRLDGLKQIDFEAYVKNKCSKFSPRVIQDLYNLRSQYPIFGFSLE